MSDIYVPGVRSRLNTDKIVEDLMKLERVPRDRTQSNVDNLQVQKGYWQEVGRRVSALRESARNLYSFQNPFNERLATSSDSSVLTASATREAVEQRLNFTVKQIALADRFLSAPLDEKTRIERGNYIFNVGNDEIAIDFRGGTLREFADIINRRGRDKIGASLISVQSGTRSLLIESKVTGSENRLNFAGDTQALAVQLGMMEQSNDTSRKIPVTNEVVRTSGQNSANVNINDGVIKIAPLSNAALPINLAVGMETPLVLRLETRTKVGTAESFNIETPSPAPTPAGSVTYGGITIENEPSDSPLPENKPPASPVRVDDLSPLKLTFSDGTSVKLPPISDSENFTARQYSLAEFARGKTIVSLNVDNTNTHREVSIGKVEILDPTSRSGGLSPLNAVASSRDAIVIMDGIEITRATNTIDDLIPGVTLNLRGVSDKPVEINIEGNKEAIKDAIITFVGNYNRLVAEINVLTSTRGSSTPDVTSTARGDLRIIEELTYLTSDEAAAMRERLGAFGGDSTLNNLKSNLRRVVTAPYPTSMERDLTLLAQIGVSSNASRNTGYDVSRLRGYLEINESVLDSALDFNIPAIKELFANDTSGDMIADTGVAWDIDAIVRPFVETGGIIALKSSTLDSRISRDERRISTLDRQLAAKEQELKMQFAKMEAAYARMESMSTSLDNFNQQNRGNR